MTITLLRVVPPLRIIIITSTEEEQAGNLFKHTDTNAIVMSIQDMRMW